MSEFHMYNIMHVHVSTVSARLLVCLFVYDRYVSHCNVATCIRLDINLAILLTFSRYLLVCLPT